MPGTHTSQTRTEIDDVSTAPTRRGLRARWFGLIALMGLVLASCADARNDTLQPEGELARDIHFITKLTGWLATIIGIFVAAAVIFVIYKFRQRKGQEDELPKQVHGHTPAELGWTIAPALLLAFLAVVSIPTILDLSEKEEGAMVIRIEGQQWWWQYSYDLDGDGEFETVTANDIVFPAGEVVNLEITSNDVIHSFWIPNLNGKKDAVPGRVHDWKIQADEPGEYWGLCTEYCGLSHADMRMRAFALSDEDWEAWKASQVAERAAPGESFAPGSEGESIRQGHDLFALHCASCHVIGGVFEGAAENPIPLRAGVAPNLTNFMTRTSFAGAIFDLYNEDGSLNEAQLRAWIRDAPSEKPLDADNQQGMISFADQLNDEDLADLVAYLRTLGDGPIVASRP